MLSAPHLKPVTFSKAGFIALGWTFDHPVSDLVISSSGRRDFNACPIDHAYPADQ